MERQSKNLQSLKTHGSPSGHTSPANSVEGHIFFKDVERLVSMEVSFTLYGLALAYCMHFFDQGYFLLHIYYTHFYPFKDTEHSSVPEDSFTASPSQPLSEAHAILRGRTQT